METEHILSFFGTKIGDAPLSRLMIAGGVFVFFLVLRGVLARLVLGLVGKITVRTRNQIDDAILRDIERPLRFSFIVLGLHGAVSVLPPETQTLLPIKALVQSLVIFVVFWTIFCLVETLSGGVKRVFGLLGTNLGVDLHQFVTRAAKIIIIVFGIIAVLQQWGVHVATFLGGLGLAGMAIALAAKDTVQNIFGGLTIFADRTYNRGDWIETPFVEGIVEVIGLRSTKIRAFSKTLITVPNARMADAAVINWSRMPVRRVKMDIGLEYRTTRDQAARVIEKLRSYLHDHPDIDNTQTQMVHLVSFGDSAIIINLYYFTRTTVWSHWRDIINQNILDFMGIVEGRGRGFCLSQPYGLSGGASSPTVFQCGHPGTPRTKRYILICLTGVDCGKQSRKRKEIRTWIFCC